jgi:2-dehydropantoate 2-reductase
MARIAVVGVGAIGGVIASLLHLAGRHQITLCTRRPLGQLIVRTTTADIQVDANNLTDPTLAVPADQSRVPQVPRTWEPGSQQPPTLPVDWVIVATKTYDTEGAARWVQPLASSGAPVAVIQNGVEHRERFASIVPPDRTLPVIIDCPVERRPDGLVVQRGDVKMNVEAGTLGTEFASLFTPSIAGTELLSESLATSNHGQFEVRFTSSTVTIDLTEDFLTAAWRKLCFNSAGAISALTLQPAGVLRDPEFAAAAAGIVNECAAVARALGAHLDPNIAQQVIDGYRAQPFDSVNSMLADRLAGRPMEIDARNGVIVRKAESLGIPTPLNRLMVALLRASTQPTPSA